MSDSRRTKADVIFSVGVVLLRSEQGLPPSGSRARKDASLTGQSKAEGARADVIFSVGGAPLRSDLAIAGELQVLECADDLGQRLFSISEEESGLWIIEKLVLDTGEPWAHGALEEYDVCRIGNFENRHSVDWATR